MYKINGLKHQLQVHGENLANAQALPQNTSADGNEGPIKASGTNASIEIVARANTALTIADTKALTIKIQHRDGAAAFADLATIYSVTYAGGNGTIAKGAELARYVLPTNVKEEVKAVITTTDSAAAGKVDIIPTYIPR